MKHRRIRLCYVINAFGIGGAETVVLNLARTHDPDRYDVTVLAVLEPPEPDPPPMLHRFHEAGIRVAMLRQRNFRSPVALWRLFRYLLRHRFDIVHAHNRPGDYWSLTVAHRLRIPCLFLTRHLVYTDMTPRQIGRYQRLSRHLDGILAVSDTVHRACLEIEGLPPEKVTTVVNGIDTERFRPREPDERLAVRQALDIDDAEAFLLFVGRLYPQKAPEAFVRLVAGLSRRGVRVRGFMCGDGPLRDDLETLATDLAAPVTLLGLRDDVPELLGSCDLFVSTSRNEGLPLNVMEAMAAGAPFIAPAIDQITCLAGNDPELSRQFFPPPPDGKVTDAHVAEAIALAEAMLADPTRRQAVGRAGRDVIVREYSLQAMVDHYERLHREALDRKGLP